MLTHSGAARSARSDLSLAGVLAFVAGAINAAGFMVAGLFSANMTGNLSAFADHLALGDLLRALAFGGLILAFVAGALTVALIVQTAAHHRRIYALALLMQAGFLALIAALLPAPAPGAGGLALLAGLSFVMGWQNALTTMVSDARVRTTHVSGMATDLGIEVAALLRGGPGARVARPRLRLHGLTFLAFAAGGVAGALLYARSGAGLFWLSALVLALSALPSLWHHRR